MAARKNKPRNDIRIADVDKSLYEKIVKDAHDNERTIGGQMVYICKQYYKAAERRRQDSTGNTKNNDR